MKRGSVKLFQFLLIMHPTFSSAVARTMAIAKEGWWTKIGINAIEEEALWRVVIGRAKGLFIPTSMVESLVAPPLDRRLRSVREALKDCHEGMKYSLYAMFSNISYI
jgi:hypothetical protein